MEPAGSERHGRSPKGEREGGASESIEATAFWNPKESLAYDVTQFIPGGNGASREHRDMDEARRANERERVSQSKPQRSGIPKSLLRMTSHNLSPAGIEPTSKV